MLYARIDESGNVIEFPVNTRGPAMSDGIVQVSTANAPIVTWDKKLMYSGVVIVDGDYFVQYNPPSDKFVNDEAKLKAITTLKKQKTDDNEKSFKQRSKEIAGDYSDFERESWNQQRTEAIAYTVDNTTPTPLLSFISAARGVSVSIFVSLVLENTQTYESLYGALLGTYQKNKEILRSISLADESTWYLIDDVVRL
jgi:hypothetical protein